MHAGGACGGRAADEACDAATAGTTPETAIRVTKNLEREGLLDLTKPGVIKILSLQQLKEAVE